MNFYVQVYLKEEDFPKEASLLIKTKKQRIIVKISNLLGESLTKANHTLALRSFLEFVHSRSGLKLLELGGRNRSGIDWSRDFACERIMFDILPGDNVDVVGDAHKLADHFAKETKLLTQYTARPYLSTFSCRGKLCLK